MMAATLVARAASFGVRLSVRGRCLEARPPGRLPADVRAQLIAQGPALLAHLSAQPPNVLTPEEERVVMSAAVRVFALYVRSAQTRRQCGTGLPGAAPRDAAYFRALRDLAPKADCPPPLPYDRTDQDAPRPRTSLEMEMER